MLNTKKISISMSQNPLTLIFVGDDDQNDEDIDSRKVKINTLKGKSLSELVEPILISRGKSFDTHSLFLESSGNPLPLNGDAFHYNGATLYVKGKVSTCKTTRFSEMLEKYEKRASESGVSADDLELEKAWYDVIEQNDEMTIRQKGQQEAIWELFSSEAQFIKEIQVLIEIFQNSFKAIQDGGCMTEVDGGVIFENIVEVYEVNVTFWKRLKNIINEARTTKQVICPIHLIEAFNGFEKLFEPYIPFCNTDTSNLKLPKSPTSHGQYIQWCDSHGTCRRITMAGFLVKPLQRVTKYSILLKAIQNKTDDENTRFVLEEVTSRIERFVSKINKSVHYQQEQEKLNSVCIRLASYNPVDLGSEETEQILKEYCNLNLQGSIPGLPDNEKRLILKEGPMKLVEKQGKKEVYVFLFSDIFIITRLKRNIDKYIIHRPPYRLNKIQLKDLKDSSQLLLIYLNEYGIAADTVVLSSKNGEPQKWKKAIKAAKEQYEITRAKFAFQQECWAKEELASTFSVTNIITRVHTVNDKKVDAEKSELPTGENESGGKANDVDDKNNDKVLMLVGAVFFIGLNITISRLLGIR